MIARCVLLMFYGVQAGKSTFDRPIYLDPISINLSVDSQETLHTYLKANMATAMRSKCHHCLGALRFSRISPIFVVPY